MTAKFGAFKAALAALCVEHGVTLGAIGYDEAEVMVSDADGSLPLASIYDNTLGTPEEQEAARLRREREEREREAEFQRQHEERFREYAKRDATLQARMNEVGWYRAAMELIEAEARAQRSKCMRVSSDPTSPEYNPRVLGVTVNDQHVDDWAIADDFRRCVVLKDGSVLNGSVGFLLDAAQQEPTAAAPIDTGFSGVFVAEPKPAPASTPAPAPARKNKKRR
jgi:hypothetical protein